MIVEVTGKDILAGSHNRESCPIALATLRKVKPGTKVEVFRFATKFNDVKVVNSIQVSNFIGRFDFGSFAQPGNYEMDIPAEFLA